MYHILNKIRVEESGVLCSGVMYNQLFRFRANFLNFLLCIGVQPIPRVVIVSDKQGRDSAVHIHVSILPQTPLPSRLPHDIEQSALC